MNRLFIQISEERKNNPFRWMAYLDNTIYSLCHFEPPSRQCPYRKIDKEKDGFSLEDITKSISVEIEILDNGFHVYYNLFVTQLEQYRQDGSGGKEYFREVFFVETKLDYIDGSDNTSKYVLVLTKAAENPYFDFFRKSMKNFFFDMPMIGLFYSHYDFYILYRNDSSIIYCSIVSPSTCVKPYLLIDCSDLHSDKGNAR